MSGLLESVAHVGGRQARQLRNDERAKRLRKNLQCQAVVQATDGLEIDRSWNPSFVPGEVEPNVDGYENVNRPIGSL